MGDSDVILIADGEGWMWFCRCGSENTEVRSFLGWTRCGCGLASFITTVMRG